MKLFMKLSALAFALFCLTGAGHGSAPMTTVATHLYDVSRSGWNAQEPTLTTANVASSSFGLRATNAGLDAQIDAQPLLANGLLYVVTENDTVYALNAATLATVTSNNLGTPVTASTLVSGNCVQNAPTIGITSTPVYDTSTNTLYVVTFTTESSLPVYRIHALDGTTLTDKISSVVISASVTLSDSSTYNFNPAVSRQRAALLLNNGHIYIAFASFCDEGGASLRGILLDYNESNLTQAHATLTNSQNPDPLDTKFLTAIWMSGAGPAADSSGNIFVVTGNSDSGASGSSTSYNPPSNYQETAAIITPSFSLSDYFTPFNVAALDQGDLDLGSGGILILPPQPGTFPHLAVTMGKHGPLYLLNRDNMGQFTSGGPNNDLQEVLTSGALCFCSEDYFLGSDGIPRIVVPVGPGGSDTGVYTFKLSNAVLTQDQHISSAVGYFSTVSSNSTNSGTEIIWVASSEAASSTITLYAIDAIAGTVLFSGTAGTWSVSTAHNNTVPLDANGSVYVATYEEVTRFGLH